MIFELQEMALQDMCGGFVMQVVGGIRFPAFDSVLEPKSHGGFGFSGMLNFVCHVKHTISRRESHPSCCLSK